MTNKKRLAILAFTLFLLPLVTPVSQVVAAQGFNSTYNASSGTFPESVCPPWTLTDTASPENPSLSEGKLIHSTSEDGESMFYTQVAPDIDMPDPLIIEARAKLVSESTTNPLRRPMFINFTTAPDTGNILFIGTDEIFLLADQSTIGESAAVDTNDAFHTYRIEVDGAGAIKVFYDGVLTLEGSTFFSTGIGFGANQRIEWGGDGTSAAFGSSEWEFFRHNASTVSCQCVPPPDGLVSWWPGDGHANDIKNGNDGTLVNGATFASGMVGQAFSFDGADDFVEIADSASLNPSTITLDAWVNPGPVKKGSRVISKDFSAASCAAPFVTFSLEVRGEFGNKATLFFTTADDVLHTLVGTSVIPTGVFTHLAATYDGATAKIYVNGVFENSLSVSSTLKTSSAPVVIGNGGVGCRASNGGEIEFDGLIDEVEIFNRALSATEIQAIFDAGSAGKCKVDHFLCYKAKTTAGTEKFLPVPGVTLTDQFDTETVEVKKPVSLCNPADKNGEGITDPVTHLKGYKILPETAHVPQTNIKVVNQFGELFVDTIKPDRLLVPTLKDLDNPVTLPDPFEPDVDHFKCYKVKVTKGTPKFSGIQATVVDQFNQPKLYDIKKPTRLCAPVLDKEHPSGTHTLAKNPDVHLMCYKVKAAPGQPLHTKVLGIHVNNQFGPEQLDTVKEEELCVPSNKTLGGP